MMGVGHKADAGIVLVGVAALHIFQAFNDLRAHGGGKTGVQSLSQILLAGNQALQNVHTGRQIAQGLDLHTGRRVDRGEEVGSIGECDFLVCAVFGDGVVDGTLGQPGHSIGATVDEIS